MFLLPDAEVHLLMDALLSGGPTRWLALSETEPVFTSAGYTNVTEPTAGSYARLQVVAASWPAASDRAAQVTVVLPDTVDDLGVLPFWALATAPTGGTFRLPGQFADPLVLRPGTTNITADLRVEAPALIPNV